MNKAIGSNTYQGQVATFVTVDGSDATLASVIPLSNNSTAIGTGNFSIQFVGSNGSQMKVADMKAIQEMENGTAIINKYGTKTALFRYVPATTTKPAHWYLDADKDPRDRNYPMDAMKIKNGQSYTAYAGNTLADGAKITYSGQVLDIDLPFEVGSSTYIGTGNIAPCDMKLSEFIPTSNNSTAIGTGNFSIQFVGKNGSQMKVADFVNIQEMENGTAITNKYGTKTALFRYVPATTSKPAHWYLDADKDPRDRMYPMDEMKVYAGQAFTAYAGNTLSDGATILLPNALK